jgi:hypothetical protein
LLYKNDKRISLLKKDLNDSETNELEQIPLLLADRLDRYHSLVTPNEPFSTTTILDMDADMPYFQPSNYSLEFPFFEKMAKENHIDILGRDDVITNINSILHDRLDKDKYWPIIISTSRGMGQDIFTKKVWNAAH